MEKDLVIHEYFCEVAQKFSDRVALQIKKDSQWQRLTYQEIADFSSAVAGFLVKEGLKKGDCAAIILENCPQWPVIYLGIVLAGLTCVPLDPQLNPQEIETLLGDCQARALFMTHDIFQSKNIRQIKNCPEKIIFLDAAAEEENFFSLSRIKSLTFENIVFPTVEPKDIASLIYTSGTTASPKGVLLSHANLCSNFVSIQKTNLGFSADNFLSILPLHHTYAFMVTFLVPLFSGAKVTYCASFHPEDLTRIIKEAEVTVLVGVPQLFSLIHKAIFEKLKKIPFLLRPFLLPLLKIKLRGYFGAKLRMMISGGARLEPKVARDLSRLGFKIIEGYGLTETSPVVTLNPPDKVKFGSVGKPVAEVEIKIDQPDKSGIGEVLIKGPNVMQGYFKRPDLTAEVIRQGWFYSGDLGYLDREGYLYLVGRKKDVIVLASGKNIYPEELEEYYSSSPYIKEICILSHTEKKFGRQQDFLYAVIVPDLEYFRLKNEKNIREKIRWELENLSKTLSRYKHIMGFTVTKEELPRTRLKKIKRYVVAEKYLPQEPAVSGLKNLAISEEDLKILDADLTEKILGYLSRELKRPVELDSHLEIDLGIDSLSRVELGLALEALLSLKIPAELIDNASTVREIILNLKAAGSSEEAGERQKEKTWGEILRGPLPQELQEKIRISGGFLDKLFTFIFKGIFLFCLRLGWSLRIKGRKFLPQQGPYIVCPNHASYLDAFFVFSSLPLRSALNIFFIGLAAIFQHPSVRWAIKFARLIPIDPVQHLIPAMQAASFVLGHDKIVCIFPEGGRSIDGEIKEFKNGIGILVKELSVPVIPVYIKGSYYTWPRGEKFPRLHPVAVCFGPAFTAAELQIKGRRLGAQDDYAAITLGIKEEVLKLKEKEKGDE